ncbi:MAG: glycosyltransferase family 2 protein [Gammaproteobacteria bacterium]|nr:glycosyltransferase family 2 protein [Gammaproteobacteria bacterium]
MQEQKLPKVSVCVPVYNGASTILDTLKSIANQTYKNYSVLILDNKSTDGTPEIVEKFIQGKEKFTLIRFNENIGGEGNFNRCIQYADGDYTAIFHADDIYIDTILERQVEFFTSHPQAGAVFTQSYLIDDTANITEKKFMPKELDLARQCEFNFAEIFKLMLRYGNFLTFPSALVRTNVYKNEILGWRGNKYFTSADLDVWLRILLKHPIGILNEYLLKYRAGTASYSYRVMKKQLKRHDLFLVLRDYVAFSKDKVLNKYDLDNYLFLRLKENLRRAILYLIQNNPKKSRKLAKPVIVTKNILPALKSHWRFGIYMVGIAVYLLSLLPLGAFGRSMLTFVRYRKFKL